MKNKSSIKIIGKILGIVSLSIALVILFLILNHFLKTTSYQILEWLPLLVIFFIIPIGFSLGFLSIKIYFNKFARWGVILNGILFLVLYIFFLIKIFTLLFHVIV
ncbi:hypothetical protein RSJ21_05535 [Clostridium botulinum]|uniref:Membrane protein n=1 Tax=Clostridium botulinum (strain Hall / ATCC 3502 / NCTC 13319 / Type A) TaxID=441771 RepID=A5I0D4_CLOBH|nr:hypothetical protein [Clostridium botulinum]CAL82495.1 putative membrane protein [Clostridium botulinum A str. ATCC 3502]AUM87092.1 hypothetical protein RSJ15_05095 [Clostridium botulinum]AUN09898.1 hypothetical protein RSJ6_05090 [Clostridium botulinum]AUN20942.1 hypothetical protein RSJ22_05670 [Clostridium botulinum]AUN24726.1 hypothetical protein RSJ21_05535 [Clostridium botulinum]